MTVKELIERLEEIGDKELTVCLEQLDGFLQEEFSVSVVDSLGGKKSGKRRIVVCLG